MQEYEYAVHPPDTYNDYHYTMRGSIQLSTEQLFALVKHNIMTTPFLSIVEANESAEVFHIVSNRKEDPRGIIEFGIYDAQDKPSFIPTLSQYRLRINDEEYLEAVRKGGLQARYGAGCKHEDTIGGLLIREASGEEERQLFSSALRASYSTIASSVPQMLIEAKGSSWPGEKEIIELSQLFEKYKDIYAEDEAAKIAKEIDNLKYSLDAQNQLSTIVEKNRKIVASALVLCKKALQWQLVVVSVHTPFVLHSSRIQKTLNDMDEIMFKFHLDPTFLPN